MNFLAHAYLSPPEPGVLVGNMVADFVKGRVRHTLPADLQQGIRLHRRIDAFTDLHPLVLRCVELLANRWGRYATILVDIFFDHCLAADNGPATRHSRCPEFVQRGLPSPAGLPALLPARRRLAVHAMTADDWLNSYASSTALRWPSPRLSRRLRHDIELAPAVDDFAARRGDFDAAFAAFFPQLIAHASAIVEPV